MVSLNDKLLKQARQYLVGGVNSPVRSFNYIGLEPILIEKGKGSKIYDYDGKEYIDYVLSWGPLILGHSHPKVINELKRAMALGLSFGMTNKHEIDLAKEIKKAISFIDKIRFVNSGTEAVMTAVRLSRAYTKRDKILKFENAYHGHTDYLLAKAGSGLATLNIPSSLGVPKDFTNHTIVAPFGNRDAFENIFRKYGNRIGAVLVEPVGGNFGVVLPDINFLKFLRKFTKKYNSLLIFDEIITGFRFGYGSAAQQFGIEPDLICLGKIIGGGLPIGAVGGKDNVMNLLAPKDNVYQAGTFSGNPVVMQAGITTLKILEKEKDRYRKLFELTEFLSKNIQNAAKLASVALRINYFGSMFSIKFTNKKYFGMAYKYLLENGVFIAPSEFEANFISFSHTKRDIEKTIKLFRESLNKIGDL
ncbi:MAG: glutamate-1-semialdehyde 2,1-aminomutase [Candidatus Omnitrophota bacterium]